MIARGEPRSRVGSWNKECSRGLVVLGSSLFYVAADVTAASVDGERQASWIESLGDVRCLAHAVPATVI